MSICKFHVKVVITYSHSLRHLIEKACELWAWHGTHVSLIHWYIFWSYPILFSKHPFFWNFGHAIAISMRGVSRTARNHVCFSKCEQLAIFLVLYRVKNQLHPWNFPFISFHHNGVATSIPQKLDMGDFVKKSLMWVRHHFS